MKIIQPKIIIASPTTVMKLNNPDTVIEFLADCARVSYQSFEKKNGIETERRLVRNCVNNGHTSILEHDYLTFDIITNRAISMELIRHRMASYVQESTRYVQYDGDKAECTYIEPIFRKEELYDIWKRSCEQNEKDYTELRQAGAQPQEARSVLNNSFKTQIRITRNFRAMREFLELRCAKPAHPEVKIIAIPMLFLMLEKWPEIFEGIDWDEEFAAKYLYERWRQYIEVKPDLIEQTKRIELVEEG